VQTRYGDCAQSCVRPHCIVSSRTVLCQAALYCDKPHCILSVISLPRSRYDTVYLECPAFPDSLLYCAARDAVSIDAGFESVDTHTSQFSASHESLVYAVTHTQCNTGVENPGASTPVKKPTRPKRQGPQPPPSASLSPPDPISHQFVLAGLPACAQKDTARIFGQVA
jgi:hypothetical protein